MIMKNLLLLFTSLFIFANGWATSITVTGKVSGTWNVDTVNVAGDIRINADTSLLIMPGTRVIFQGHFVVWALGVIRALGNADHPVVFTIADTTGFADTLSTSGGWHGFLFNQPDGSVDTSYFSFCRFEYGKAVAGDTTGKYGGAMRIFHWNKVVISDCEFFHNMAYKWGGAIYAKYADITLIHNTFSGNRCGTPSIPYGYGGGLCSVHSSPMVKYCLFEDNSSTGLGGGASFEYSDPLLQFNIFHQNFSALGGGFTYIRSLPTHVASNNLVYGNEALFFGGGIACMRTNAVFSNNTVTGNQSAYGGGFYANDSAFPSNYNTILYGNSAALGQEVYIWDVISAPNFFYCNIAGGVADFQGSGGQQGYHGIFENNLDTIPGFSMSTEFPYALENGSPMIDRGTPDTTGLQLPETDLAGNSRFYNNRTDIGAYEWNPATGINPKHDKGMQVRICPNPVKSDFSVSFNTGLPGSFSLSIYTLEEKQVWHSGDKYLPAGVQNVGISARETGLVSRPEGFYLLRISGNNATSATPFIFVK